MLTERFIAFVQTSQALDHFSGVKMVKKSSSKKHGIIRQGAQRHKIGPTEAMETNCARHSLPILYLMHGL